MSFQLQTLAADHKPPPPLVVTTKKRRLFTFLSPKLDQKAIFMKNTKNKPPIFCQKLSKNIIFFKKKNAKMLQNRAKEIDTILAPIPTVSPQNQLDVSNRFT